MGGTGSAIKSLVRRSNDLQSNNDAIDKFFAYLRPRGKKTQEFFDKTLLTPGTTLMVRIDERLEKWVKTLDIPMVIYSSHLDPGEAEHKIFDYIRKNELLTSYGDTLLFGLDRDLIILSLLSSQRNLYIVQDDKRKETIEYFSIDYLKVLLKKSLRFEGCTIKYNKMYD